MSADRGDPARRARRRAAMMRGLMGSGMPRLLGPLLRGRGIVFCGHRVIAAAPTGFAPTDFEPTRGLSVTTDFLDRLLGHLRRRGIALVGLDEIADRLAAPAGGPPFAHLSFDDGYADMLTRALPVFERHGAPFSVFITTGFVARTHLMWWTVLEAAIAGADRIEGLPTRSPAEKAAAYARLEARCRRDPTVAEAIVGRQLVAHGPGLAERAQADVLTWPMLETLARSPLVRVGCHAVSHAPLARLDDAAVGRELARARRVLERRLGRPVTALAYPYGDRASVDRGTVALAAAAGFTLGLTTERAMLRAADRGRPLALPRTTLNGWHEDLAVIDFHLSGLAGLTRRRVAA